MSAEMPSTPGGNQELLELKNKLTTFINIFFSQKEGEPTHEMITKSLLAMKQKFLQAIEENHIANLQELAETIDQHLDYERKYRDTKENKKRWDDLNATYEQLLAWIKTLK